MARRIGRLAVSHMSDRALWDHALNNLVAVRAVVDFYEAKSDKAARLRQVEECVRELKLRGTQLRLS